MVRAARASITPETPRCSGGTRPGYKVETNQPLVGGCVRVFAGLMHSISILAPSQSGYLVGLLMGLLMHTTG